MQREGAMIPPGKDERLLDEGWVYMYSPIMVGVVQKRLLILTNQHFYICSDSCTVKCKACPAYRFCPSGPSMMETPHEYSDVKWITKSRCGQRFLLELKGSSYVVFSERIAMTESFLDIFERLIPPSEDRVIFRQDQSMKEALSRSFLCLPDEELLAFTRVVKINKRGKEQERTMALTTKQLYNFDEHVRGWTRSLFLPARKTNHPLEELARYETTMQGCGGKKAVEIKDDVRPTLELHFASLKDRKKFSMQDIEQTSHRYLIRFWCNQALERFRRQLELRLDRLIHPPPTMGGTMTNPLTSRR
ncbi:hypothetical protein PAPYR_9205 [Paratrimastix pyriformis]|uniref:Uncharacterized protein n=1 Tax=Paratrimastix pyriformis TaxID=342808 RepID=A0ABQ8UCL3_9EUKA|nr:hypothetical protein PAPYR_9205 [Paratrimastix pyriformis]